MKILLDAQLPRSLVPLLQAEGCDTLHTLDLPDGNRTTDSTISAHADQQGRVVFSKDADFIQSHLLNHTEEAASDRDRTYSQSRTGPVIAPGVAIAETPLCNQ